MTFEILLNTITTEGWNLDYLRQIPGYYWECQLGRPSGKPIYIRDIAYGYGDTPQDAISNAQHADVAGLEPATFQETLTQRPSILAAIGLTQPIKRRF